MSNRRTSFDWTNSNLFEKFFFGKLEIGTIPYGSGWSKRPPIADRGPQEPDPPFPLLCVACRPCPPRPGWCHRPPPRGVAVAGPLPFVPPRGATRTGPAPLFTLPLPWLKGHYRPAWWALLWTPPHLSIPHVHHRRTSAAVGLGVVAIAASRWAAPSGRPRHQFASVSPPLVIPPSYISLSWMLPATRVLSPPVNAGSATSPTSCYSGELLPSSSYPARRPSRTCARAAAAGHATMVGWFRPWAKPATLGFRPKAAQHWPECYIFLGFIFWFKISRKLCKFLKYIENGIKFREIPNKFHWNPLE
jgi:hypothetical protein